MKWCLSAADLDPLVLVKGMESGYRNSRFKPRFCYLSILAGVEQLLVDYLLIPGHFYQGGTGLKAPNLSNPRGYFPKQILVITKVFPFNEVFPVPAEFAFRNWCDQLRFRNRQRRSPCWCPPNQPWLGFPCCLR